MQIIKITVYAVLIIFAILFLVLGYLEAVDVQKHKTQMRALERDRYAKMTEKMKERSIADIFAGVHNARLSD